MFEKSLFEANKPQPPLRTKLTIKIFFRVARNKVKLKFGKKFRRISLRKEIFEDTRPLGVELDWIFGSSALISRLFNVGKSTS